MGSFCSEFKKKAFEVDLPQGTVLSPLLFSVHSRNISVDNVLGAKLLLYASNVAVAVVGREPLCLQIALEKLVAMLSICASKNNIVFSIQMSVTLSLLKI